jgi:hypothetical protein
MPDVIVGILMLDTAFDRVPGDVGHPDTFAFGARYAVVEGASARRAVEDGARGLLEPFVAAGLRLAADGCDLITTSCGFLAVHQRALAAALPVPVVSSSLLALPSLLAALDPAARVGVVTANAGALTAAHLDGAGVAAADRPRLVLIGLEHTAHLYPALIGDAPGPDPAIAGPEVVAAVVAAVESDPSIAALVCECTNLPPYRAALTAATGLPVTDIVTVVEGVVTERACGSSLGSDPENGVFGV